MIYQIEYRTRWGENLAMHTADGRFIEFSTADGITWTGEADIQAGTEYRYCVMRDGNMIRTEVGCMPHVADVHSSQHDTVTDRWKETERVAGVAVPVFSLRSKGSQGVGDFGDLKKLIDWAVKAHLKVIQILPINDTTTDGNWKDSYPYNSISCRALHPMYLDLRQEGVTLPAPSQPDTHLDYEAVNKTKRECIRKLFTEKGDAVLGSEGFRTFFKANENWLADYAQFRATHYPIPASKEQKDVRLYYFTQYLLHVQLSEVAAYAKENGIILKGDIPIGVNREGVDAATHPELFNMDGQTGAPPDFFAKDGQNWGFPTYNWDEMAKDGYSWWKSRMQGMAQYFSAYRIDHLLGFFRIWEIPMPEKSGLMGHFSPALPMDVNEIGKWEDMDLIMQLFLEDKNEKGKYHPKIGAKDEPAYQQLSDSGKAAFNNLYEHYFYHRHTQFWYEEAMKKLPALTESNLMICCGEDLGMVPECVPWVMRQLGILSLEIQSMPKEMGVQFGNPAHNPVLSVCTISSHDTPTFRGWWEEEHDMAQSYYNNVLRMKGTAPEKAPGWLVERVIRDHLASPSAFCVLTLQDWLGMDDSLRNPDARSERINIPANPRHYWRWRMHLNIEDLLDADSFNEHIRCLVDESER